MWENEFVALSSEFVDGYAGVRLPEWNLVITVDVRELVRRRVTLLVST